MVELRDNPGYETRDAQISPLVKTGLFIFALMVISFVSMTILFRVFNYYQPMFDDPVPPLATARVINNSPRLQVDPPAEKLAYDRKTEEMLSSLLNDGGMTNDQAVSEITNKLGSMAGSHALEILQQWKEEDDGV